MNSREEIIKALEEAEITTNKIEQLCRTLYPNFESQFNLYHDINLLQNIVINKYQQAVNGNVREKINSLNEITDLKNEINIRLALIETLKINEDIFSKLRELQDERLKLFTYLQNQYVAQQRQLAQQQHQLAQQQQHQLAQQQQHQLAQQQQHQLVQQQQHQLAQQQQHQLAQQQHQLAQQQQHQQLAQQQHQLAQQQQHQLAQQQQYQQLAQHKQHQLAYQQQPLAQQQQHQLAQQQQHQLAQHKQHQLAYQQQPLAQQQQHQSFVTQHQHSSALRGGMFSITNERNEQLHQNKQDNNRKRTRESDESVQVNPITQFGSL